MESQKVNTSTDPAAPVYTQNTEFRGRDYVLLFEWNQRDSTWYMTISNVEGVLLLAGLPVVLDWPLMAPFVSEELPEGDFMVVRFQGPSRPGLTDLGDGTVMFFVWGLVVAEDGGSVEAQALGCHGCGP